MTTGKDMAKVEGLNRRGSRWYVRIIVPPDLLASYGKARVNIALGTSDRREATLRATLKRAEWLAEFDAKRRESNPTAVASITPELATLLAGLVRAHVLADDDRVRSDLPLLAEMVHVRRELDLRARQPLRIPQWKPREAREDDLTGLTPDEAKELAGLNAYLDGNAAMAMAGGNLAAVLPLVTAQAAKLGVAFDAKTPGARAALLQCLKAYRTAHHGMTLRDLGDVVETPAIEYTPPEATKPRTLRDVFDRWQVSGEKVRTTDAITAYDRALRQFEGQHKGLALASITRDMGDIYRTWLRNACKTSKTASDRINAIKSLLKYAADTLHWIPFQPWRGLAIKATTTNKRRPWTEAELTTLFTSPLHTSYALPDARLGGREAAYWIPLLGLFTGARLGELCQLHARDVQTVDGLPVIALTDDGEGQQIKTTAGRRTIPLHSELIRLGFMDYAASIQAQGAGVSLWPSLPLRTGKPSDYFGRWFLAHRKALGMAGAGGASFHYFRHTVRPLMRRAGFAGEVRDRITGHETPGSVGDVVYDGLTLRELVPAVEAIRFPYLTLARVAPSVVHITPYKPRKATRSRARNIPRGQGIKGR
jgi:integrase